MWSSLFSQWWWSVCEIAKACPSKHSNARARSATTAAATIQNCCTNNFIWILFCAFIVIWNALKDLYGTNSKGSWFFVRNENGNEELCALDLWIENCVCVDWMVCDPLHLLSPDNQFESLNHHLPVVNMHVHAHQPSTVRTPHYIIVVSVSLECASFRVNQWFSSMCSHLLDRGSRATSKGFN